MSVVRARARSWFAWFRVFRSRRWSCVLYGELIRRAFDAGLVVSLSGLDGGWSGPVVLPLTASVFGTRR